MKLRINKATIEQLNYYPGEDAPSCVLVLKAPLTEKLADQLRCKEVVYTADGVIRSSIEGKISLSLSVEEADLNLGQSTSVSPNQIHKWKIERKEEGSGDARDTRLSVTFRSKFSGKEPGRILQNFLNSINNSDFALTIDAKQESFDFEGDGSEEEEAEEVAAG